MIGEKRPGIAGSIGLRQHIAEAFNKPLLVVFIPENLLLLNASDNDMMKHSGGVKSRGSWHAATYNTLSVGKQQLFTYLRASPCPIFTEPTYHLLQMAFVDLTGKLTLNNALSFTKYLVDKFAIA